LKRRSCRGDGYWPSDRPRYAGLVAELERKGERVRAGLLSPAEARTVEHLATPIGEHVAAYIGNLEASGAGERYVREARRILDAVLTGCEFRTLANLDNRRQRGDCSGDDRDRTGNLLVANQAIESDVSHIEAMF